MPADAPMLPVYKPALYVPPPPPLPTLSVTQKGQTYRLFLLPALIERLNLRDKQPINLLPPSYGSPFWHLDLRPEAERRISFYRGQSPRVEGVRLPEGLVLPGQPLILCLQPGEPYYPHVYPLLPDALPTQAQ